MSRMCGQSQAALPVLIRRAEARAARSGREACLVVLPGYCMIGILVEPSPEAFKPIHNDVFLRQWFLSFFVHVVHWSRRMWVDTSATHAMNAVSSNLQVPAEAIEKSAWQPSRVCLGGWWFKHHPTIVERIRTLWYNIWAPQLSSMGLCRVKGNFGVCHSFQVISVDIYSDSYIYIYKYSCILYHLSPLSYDIIDIEINIRISPHWAASLVLWPLAPFKQPLRRSSLFLHPCPRRGMKPFLPFWNWSHVEPMLNKLV